MADLALQAEISREKGLLCTFSGPKAYSQGQPVQKKPAGIDSAHQMITNREKSGDYAK